MSRSNSTRFDQHASGVQALVRTGRAGEHSVNWSTPFWTGLHLERDKNGCTCVLGLQDAEWAEYDPRNCEESDGVFTAEDYYLEIIQISD